MKDDVETPAERREHVARLKSVMPACVSSRQRRWLREAIRLASRSDRPGRT
jgi:hypothetical protein